MLHNNNNQKEEETSLSPVQKKKKNWVRELREWTVSFAIAIVVALLVQNYAFAQTEVHNVSMQSTLFEGNRLIEDKLSYRFGAPSRGDIVIINGPESELRLIKRIIGVAGDEIDMADGRVKVNGQFIDEPYAKGQTFPRGLELPYTVPEGTVFVMGDNRENSQDSRDLGPIALSSVEGRAIFRLWPLNKFGSLN
ncbi:signal peptidase I [Paenibacillus sp. GCM10027626]|uniref:signal peptidase I n=1 Tax=Paenibacillus sp. GCM10027626 TaxID=3273411 RepID=UPI003626E033